MSFEAKETQKETQKDTQKETQKQTHIFQFGERVEFDPENAKVYFQPFVGKGTILNGQKDIGLTLCCVKTEDSKEGRFIHPRFLRLIK